MHSLNKNLSIINNFIVSTCFPTELMTYNVHVHVFLKETSKQFWCFKSFIIRKFDVCSDVQYMYMYIVVKYHNHILLAN